MTPSILSLTALGIVASLATTQAAIIAQTNLNPNDANPWNTPAVWNGSTVSSTDDYNMVAGTNSLGTSFTVGATAWSFNTNLRDTSGASPTNTTFTGGRLINNALTRILMKGVNNTTSTASIVFNGGGHIIHAPNSGGAGNAGTTNLAGTINATTGSTSAIGMIPSGNATNTLNITSTITGSGTIQLVTTGGTSRTAFLNLNGDISNFSGTFLLSTNTGGSDGGAPSATSAFSIAAASANLATLNLATASTRFLFNLNSDLNFGSVIIGTSTLGVGTYTFDDLNTIAPGKFINNSGSITVVPEPSALLLTGLMAMGWCVGVRSRNKR